MHIAPTASLVILLLFRSIDILTGFLVASGPGFGMGVRVGAGSGAGSGSRSDSRHRRAFMDGDIIIGVLLPIHQAPTTKTYTSECGKIWENYGIHRIEALFLTIDEINRRSDLLPNIRLGVDVRDECWFTPIALEQTIDFIRTNLYYNDKAREKSSAVNTSSSSTCVASESDSDGVVTEKPVALVIGPGSSTMSLQVQNLLSLFSIPQIGYSATSNELTEFNYYARVVPPDKHQAEALAMLCSYNRWNYVSLVHTKGNYGGSGIQLFKEFADKLNVCTAMEGELADNADYAEYDATVRKLNSSRARVVVCFCEGKTLQNLINATARLDLAKHFLFVGSDGWADRLDVLGDVIDTKSGKRELSDAALGVLSIRVHSKAVSHFDDYFLGLTPNSRNDTRNRWFNEFWQNKFSCNLPGSGSKAFDRTCIGNESLRAKDYKQDTKLGFVVSAVYTAAYALHHLYLNVCTEAKGACPELMPINGTRLMQYLVNVTYQVDNDTTVWLNTDADPPAWYDIMNYQMLGSGEYQYGVVGEYQSDRSVGDRLTLVNASDIFWPTGGYDGQVVESRCSPECQFGYVRQLNQDVSKRCCWVCVACNEHARIVDNYTCSDCNLGEFPDETKSECVTVPIEHIHWMEAGALFATCFSTVGVLVTLISLVVFAVHHNTSVVKASTRELSYIILLGILLAYCCSYILIAKPTLFTCTMNRLVPGVAFTMIYASLATKTNRIARILAGTKRIITKKPKFVSATSQLLITLGVIFIELVTETFFLIYSQPEAKVVYPTRKEAKLLCTIHDGEDERQVSLIIPLTPNIVLIVLCTFYAIKTRNLPENFNEAKFIGFTMYTTCIIWVGFAIVYFGSDFKIVTMSTSISLSASVALVLLFFPKLYIIIWHPERNVRSAFTTTTDVRCHIGGGTISSKPQTNSGHNNSNHNFSAGIESRRSSKFEDAAVSLYRQKTMLDRWRRGARNFAMMSMRSRASTSNTAPESSASKLESDFDPIQAEKAAQKLTILSDALQNTTTNVSHSSSPSCQHSVKVVRAASVTSADITSAFTNGRLRVSQDPISTVRSTQTDDDLLLVALEDLRKRRLAELLMNEDMCFTDVTASVASSPTKAHALTALASKYKSRRHDRSSADDSDSSREVTRQLSTKSRTSIVGSMKDSDSGSFSRRLSLNMRIKPAGDKTSFDRSPRRQSQNLSIALRHAGLPSSTTSLSKLINVGRLKSASPKHTGNAESIALSSTDLSGDSSLSLAVVVEDALQDGATRKLHPAAPPTMSMSSEPTSTGAMGVRLRCSHNSMQLQLNKAKIIEENEESEEDGRKVVVTKAKQQKTGTAPSSSSTQPDAPKPSTLSILSRGSSGSGSGTGTGTVSRNSVKNAQRKAEYERDGATSSSDLECSSVDQRLLQDHSNTTSASATPIGTCSLRLDDENLRQSLENMSVLGLKLLDKEEERFEKLKNYLKSRGVNIDLEEIQTTDV